jgi:plastocyanin
VKSIKNIVKTKFINLEVRKLSKYILKIVNNENKSARYTNKPLIYKLLIVSFISMLLFVPILRSSDLVLLDSEPILPRASNMAPNAASNPSPSHGSTGASKNPILRVDVYDPDGDPMTVSFYDNGGNLIGVDTNVPSGGTASVQWQDLRGSTTYRFYVITDDGTRSTRSETWTFKTFESRHKVHLYFAYVYIHNDHDADFLIFQDPGEWRIGLAGYDYMYPYWDEPLPGSGTSVAGPQYVLIDRTYVKTENYYHDEKYKFFLFAGECDQGGNIFNPYWLWDYKVIQPVDVPEHGPFNTWIPYVVRDGDVTFFYYLYIEQHAPIAAINISPGSKYYQNQPIQLNPSISDGDQDVLMYEWDFHYDGTFNIESTERNPTYSYPDLGNYQIALRVTDGYVWCFDESTITIISSDVPAINQPNDIIYEFGTTGHSITWNAHNHNPFEYEIRINGGLVESGPWDGSSITLSIDFLPVGIHTIRCKVIDLGLQSAQSAVKVTVKSEAAPIIDQPDNLVIEEDSSGNFITWHPSDYSPYTYEILRDDVVIESGPWDGGDITIEAKHLPIGTYNFKCIVYDVFDNSATDVVTVNSIDTQTPFIDQPDDITYEVGSSGHSITWSPSEKHPVTYIIRRDGEIMYMSSWSGGPITVKIDLLPVGVYEFNCSVYDSSGNMGSTKVIVTVVDTVAPTIDELEDMTYEESSTGNTVTWNPYDANPQSFTIEKNGIEIFSGSWGGGAVSINVDGLPIGVYTYICTVYDVSGNMASDSVDVTVIDPVIPSIDHPEDIEYEESSTGNIIKWTPYDANPQSFTIEKNGMEVVSGSWGGGAVSINVDGLPLGVYTYTCTVYDASGNIAIDSVVVTVLDVNPPESTINLIGTLGNGEWYITDVVVSLSASDSFSGVAKIEYSINGGEWMSYTQPLVVSSEGETTISYRSIDFAGNVEETQIQTLKIDKSAPEIIITPYNEIRTDADPPLIFSWNIQDISEYAVIEIKLNGELVSNDPIKTLSIGNEIGVYILSIYAEDINGFSNQVISRIEIIDDDTEPPELSDLIILDNIFELSISFNGVDDSSIGEILIFIDNELILTYTVSSDDTNFNFNLPNNWIMKPGIHQVSIKAYDADGDRIGDSLFSIIDGTFEISFDEMKMYVLSEIDQLIEEIQESSDDDWRNNNNKASITNKLIALKNMINENNFEDAYDNLLQDIKPLLTGLKTDENEEPWDGGIFNNPWVISEELQEIFRLICNEMLINIIILIENS